MRLFEHEQGIDAETGLPHAVAFSPIGFKVNSDVINYAAKAIATVRAADAEKHKDDPGWMDGRRYYAEPLDPD